MMMEARMRVRPWSLALLSTILLSCAETGTESANAIHAAAATFRTPCTPRTPRTL